MNAPDPSGTPRGEADEVEPTLDQNAGQQVRARERSAQPSRDQLGLAGYEVQRSLGRGAFGEVWLAVQENTGREVAIKVFSRHRGLDWALLKREVGKLVEVLGERRIVHLLAVGWDADPPYYIMEFVRGGSLADRLATGPLPAGEAVPLVREVAEALVYLHSKAILHCDLKPSNILLDERGQVRLADFGQARLSDEEGPPAGTLFYLAPELADPRARPDVRSDLYSLGAVLYTLLTGKAPYAAAGASRDLASTGTLTERLQKYREVVTSAPEPAEHRHLPGVDKDLAAIVDRCLRRDPAERFANAQQVLDALAARDRRRAQRPLLAFGILGPAALLAALFGIGSWVWMETRAKAEQTLTGQALEGNRELARMVAAAVDDRLAGILRRVAREADNPRLAQMLSHPRPGDAGAESPELQAATDALHAQYSGRSFYSWFVADRKAYMWARSPRDPTVIGESFPDREWFNGIRNYAQAPPGVLARSEPGLTLVFESKAEERPLVFTAASPVKAADGRVVGVLAASVKLAAFNDWLAVAEGEVARDGCPSRFIVLINHRGQLVRHPCPRGKAGGKRPKIPLPREAYLDRPEVAGLLRTKTDADFTDPLRPGAPYLAAVSELSENAGWYVLIQQRTATALWPLEGLAAEVDKLGWIALAVGLAAVGGLWLVLLRMVRPNGARP